MKFFNVAVIFCLALMYSACGLLTDTGYFEMGQDRITSIKGAGIGERKIVAKKSAIENGVQTNTYEYKTDAEDMTQAANDVFAYIMYLINNERFENLIAFDGLPYEGGIELKLAKESVDEGKIIILEIVYDSKGYKLIFTKGVGSLTRQNEDQQDETDYFYLD